MLPSDTRWRRRDFGVVRGRGVDCYRLGGPSGLTVEVITYGAAIHRVALPIASGETIDVALGLPSLDDYVKHDQHRFGATIGRYANRIRGARFKLDNVDYLLAANDSGNLLHGGWGGFDRRVWDVLAVSSSSVALRLERPYADQGFPGTLVVDVSYSVEGGALCINYLATSDAPTVLNLTNHTYWNLNGAGQGSVADHLLQLNASSFTPLAADLIPSGEIIPVAGTALDFVHPRPLGDSLSSSDEQIVIAGGLDHNFILDRGQPRLTWAARLVAPKSGRTLEVRTTEPGIQVYTANAFDPVVRGRGGSTYRRWDAVALETQHFPDSPNQPHFPSTLLKPEDVFTSTTQFTFGSSRSEKGGLS